MKKQLKFLMLSTAFAVILSAQAFAAGMLDLRRTGQTRCYDTAGIEIVCTGSGQDAELRSGAPIPTPRFLDNANGTVTDRLTGLIWLKNANCAVVSPKTFDDALTSVATLASGACGLSDGSKAGEWRVPNRTELLSLIDRSKSNPALLIGHPFDNVVNDMYRTSTSYAGGSGNMAWTVHLGGGFANGYYGNGYKNNLISVWPVRAGQF